MSWHSSGLLWDDPEVEKKGKRIPPEPVWLDDSYLPWLDEARAYSFEEMTDAELIEAHERKDSLVWDIEVYPNYFLAGFKSVRTGKIVSFEMDDNFFADFDRDKFRWILENKNFELIGFNDTHFDLPIACAAIHGYDCEALMRATEEIINQEVTAWQFYVRHKLKRLHVNHIDLIELTPLAPSLKVAAGRFHAPRMQDLPFTAGKYLTSEQTEVLKWYWANDLENTLLLYKQRLPEIQLRAIMSNAYNVDLRSMSDPQIAEAVVRAEIKRITGDSFFKKAEIVPGRKFKYFPPSYISFETLAMNEMARTICEADFVVDEGGSPIMPNEIESLKVNLGVATYNLGIGGLHSQEKQAIHKTDEEYVITDNDVTSYYPSLMIQQGMYPPNIGPVFINVFKEIYEKRLYAKSTGDKTTADTLKIVLNGTFGKTGERGGKSIFYYPEMMIQVTLTGQLALLMLIESLELHGIEVVSANTDGIMIKCHRSMAHIRDNLLHLWEKRTGLQLESTLYKAVYQRDVNNYIAFYESGKTKTKGAYAFAHESGLKKNPACEICTEAAIAYLSKDIPLEQTITTCKDFTKFVEVRLVRGGACKNGEYLGKAIRWYYAEGEEGEIINAKNGHFVPKSQGAKPCMVLPDSFPNDVCFSYYVNRARGIVEELTATKPLQFVANDAISES